MPKEALPLPTLTDEQKALLESYWHEDARSLLTRLWPDRPELNLRTVHWKAIRAYLASIGKDPDAPKQLAKDVDALTSEQQEFIRASYRDSSGPVELARTLYNNPKLTAGANEVRLVSAYIRSIDPLYRKEDVMVDEVEYTPPKSVTQLAGRINGYGIIGSGKKLFEGGKFTPQESRQLEALLSYMRRPVFKVEAEKFTRRIDREVFEEIFLSNCWDKSDLGPEHVLQHIQLASVSVQRNQADRMARKLNDRFEASLEDPTQRLSQTEVEALQATAGKTAECLKQINTLIKTLAGERFKQQNEKMAGSASMHPLVEMWRAEETRRKIIALAANKQQAGLKQEVERLSTMDSLKVEMFGIDPNTIVY